MQRYILLILTTVLLLASCSTDDFLEGNDTGETAPLTIASVSTSNNISSVMSRAALDPDETALPSGSGLGLYLYDSNSHSDGTTYNTKTFCNVKYSSVSGYPWAFESTDAASSEIILTATTGTLYAYYPYNSTATTTIPVSTSVNGDDYCWGYASNLSASNHSAALTLSHKLSRIDVTITKGTYSGSGSITSVSLSGDNVAKSGIMAPATGAITASKGTATIDVSSANYDVDNTPVLKCLIVPVTSVISAKDVTLDCTIDGNAYSIVLPNLLLTAGIRYTASLTLNSDGLLLTDLGTWNSNTVTIQLNTGTVTLNNVSEKIALNIKKTNDDVTIISMPTVDGYWVSRPESITTDNCTSATSTLSDGVRTTTITGVTDDITVTFSSINDGLSLAVPYVDLGLSSGTMWAKCNANDKDHTTVGTYSEESYGGYFSWGETDGNKDYYGWCESEFAGSGVEGWVATGYKYGRPYRTKNVLTFYYTNYITKYILEASKSYGYVSDTNYGNYYDGLSELEPADDAATMNWGSDWQTPSITQYNELTSSTTATWTSLNSKPGYQFAKNDVYIFLPAAGYSHLSANSWKGQEWGCYWSRDLHEDDSQEANRLLFSEDGINSTSIAADSDRPFGDSVRPVLYSDALSKTYK